MNAHTPVELGSSEARHHAARMYALAKILKLNGEQGLAEWAEKAADYLRDLGAPAIAKATGAPQ